jgi:hypothetical protein
MHRLAVALLTATTIIAGTLLAPAVALAQDHSELPIRFAARAQARGTVLTGQTARVEITISAISEGATRDALLDTLVTEGPEAMKKALQNIPEVGRVRIDGGLSYPLQFARVFPNDDGGMLVRVVTDRPIRAFEAMASTRVSEFAFTIIELNIDSEGAGDGAAAIGVEITVDKENRTFRLSNYDTSPVRLSSVRPIEIR